MSEPNEYRSVAGRLIDAKARLLASTAFGTQPSLLQDIRYALTPGIRVKVMVLRGLRWEALIDE